MQLRIVLLVLAFLSAVPATAAPVRCADDGDGGACLWGRAEAFDGAAVQIRGLRVHLVGIAVPTRKDLCQDKLRKEEFDCARPARKRMAELLAKGVACDLLDVAADRLYGRCRVADGDLGRQLVASGVAKATKDGPYESEQAAALAAKKGLWSPDLLPPREWEAVRRKGDKGGDDPKPQ